MYVLIVFCLISMFGIRSNLVFGYEASIEPQVQKYPVNDTCLNCICDASSNCDKSKYCKDDVCGMFRMTEPYWIDGGKHIVEGNKEDLSTKQGQLTAYQNCANDEKCARQTAYDYLTRYATDCDKNQIIDCFDYAGMHKYGPFGGCQKNPIEKSGNYYTVLNTCLYDKNKGGNGHF